MSFSCSNKNNSECKIIILDHFKQNPEIIIVYLNKEKRDGPWVPLIVKEEYVNQNCPDCVEPILMKCFGNHEVFILSIISIETHFKI
jgi:hypothetical protein